MNYRSFIKDTTMSFTPSTMSSKMSLIYYICMWKSVCICVKDIIATWLFCEVNSLLYGSNKPNIIFYTYSPT